MVLSILLLPPPHLSENVWLLFQVRAHQLVLPPCEVVIKAVSEYVSSIKDLGSLDAIARDVFKQSQVGGRSNDSASFILDVTSGGLT